MSKKLIGWTIILFEQDNQKEVCCSTFYNIEQKVSMSNEVTNRIEQDQTFKVVPEFYVPRV